MNKIGTLLVVIALVISSSALGGTKVGQWSGGAHLGYSLALSGFGDYGGSFAYPGFDWSYKPTAAFGVFGQYQLKEKIAIGAELYWQGTKVSTPAFYGGSAGGSFTNVLFLGTYELNPGAEGSVILLAGAGIYESDFGINGGAAYRKFINPSLAWLAGARVHADLASGTTFAWLQLFGGVQYFFGNK